MKKIKLFFFIPSLQGGGAERVSYRIASHINPELFDVTLLVGKKKGQYVPLLPPGLVVHNFNKNRVSSCIIPLAVQFFKQKPDVIISFMHHSNIAVLLAKLLGLGRVKVITSERNVMEPIYERIPKFFLPLVRIIYKLSDASLSNSIGLKNNVKDFLKISEKKFRVIYNPVDLKLIKIKAAEDPGHHWLEKKEGPVVIGIGRLEPQKDFATLIRAFAKAKKPTGARLLILGEGRMRGELTALAKNLEIDLSFDLPGFKINPYSFLKRADLFVLSSLWEGFPNVLPEALALGLPVISTNCRFGPSEVIKHGFNGLLVAPGNVDEMALAIEHMLLKKDLAENCAKNAAGSVNRLEIEEIARQYEDFVISLAK